MARRACRTRIVRLMATDAARHRRNAGGLRHGIELGNVTMAHHALHASLQMLAVRPGNPRSDLIHAHPGNRLRSFGRSGERHTRGVVAHNARRTGWKRHLTARIRIGVALLASQAEGDVSLMAVGDRLLWGELFREIVGHLLFGGCLLRSRAEHEKQQRHAQAEGPDHDFLPPTSSMLVPKSLNIAVAVLRPGTPVMEPPGGVQAPVW